MATTIDELVISLSLDARNFNAQQHQAVNNLRKLEQQAATSGTNTERAAQKMVDGFSRVTKEILGVGAAILGVNGLKDLAVNLAQVAAATGRMAEALELDPEMLNKWQGFLRAVGNQDFGTTTASLGALSKAVQEFRLTQRGPLGGENLAWLARMGISPADIMAGTTSQAVNAILLKVGQNINSPANADVRSTVLDRLPGMTPTLVRGLERSPTQKMLDSYLTATAAQMASASRMMEAITELALALTKNLNTLLPDAEKPVVSIANKLAKGDVAGALTEADTTTGALATQGRKDLFEAIAGWLSHIPSPAAEFSRTHPGQPAPGQTYFPDPGPIGVPPAVLDTSTMPRTSRFPDGNRRGGNVTNNITANISAPKSDDPRMWADIWADRVKAAMATGGAH